MKRTGLAGLVLLLAACGGASTPPTAAEPAPAQDGLSDEGGFVCDDFAAYARDGQPRDQRTQVVSKIGRLVGNAESELQEAHDVLTRSVDAPDSQWTVAADTFAQTCFDLGWDG